MLVSVCGELVPKHRRLEVCEGKYFAGELEGWNFFIKVCARLKVQLEPINRQPDFTQREQHLLQSGEMKCVDVEVLVADWQFAENICIHQSI